MLYAAYGSNMDIEQMKYRCPDSQLYKKGVIHNWKLCFRYSATGAYASIEKAAGYQVPIILWNISKYEEKVLDIYEGCPKYYRKKNIKTSTGEPAIIYILPNNKAYGIPSIQYYNKLQRAYQNFGFDSTILEQGLLYSLQNSSLAIE